MKLDLSQNNIIRVAGNTLFFLLLLVMMVDPGNAVLRLKDVLFVLFFAFNVIFYKPDWRNLLFILPVYLVLFITYLFAIIQQNQIDHTYFFAAIKGFAPLTLLLWIKYYNVIKLSLAPVLFTCIIILILYSLSATIPAFEWGLHVFSKEHNQMVMLTHRNWLGIPIFGMYYRSVVSFMPVLFYVTYQVLFIKTSIKWRHVVGLLLIFSVFLISGTRAMLLTPFAILGVVFYLRYLRMGNIRYLLYPVFITLGCAFLLLIVMLVTQKGDLSNEMKFGHITSYANLFNDHFEYLLFGQGPGTIFYSLGFGKMTAETEWTYFELVRNYGLLSLVILAVYLYPLYCCLKSRKNVFMIGLAFTYVIFLFVGGTNPFLLNSQGMTLIWIMYSYIFNNDAMVYPNFNCSEVNRQ